MKTLNWWLLLVICFMQLFLVSFHLGLFSFPGAELVSFWVALACYVIVALAVATYVGDYLVLKIYKWDKKKGRWGYYSAGGDWVSPGVMLRVGAYALFQMPTVYVSLLLLRK